jgi:hypothetical protein
VFAGHLHLPEENQMTPVEELRAAATRLREMAAVAPKGPWGTERYFWKTRSIATPDQWMVAVTDKNDDHVTAVSEWHDCDEPGSEHHLLAADTTAWIALMGPDKAEKIAIWLDMSASDLAFGTTAASGAALVFARSILGEAS